MMASERPGVMLYFDIEPALKMLDLSQNGALFSAIMEYAHYGVLPDLDDPLVGMAWTFVKSSIDRDGERYTKTIEKRKISGITSDFKRNYAPKHGIDPDDEDALDMYIRQRLSTHADKCQASGTPTPTTFPTQTPKAYPTPEATAAGKGSGENPSNSAEEHNFEQLRKNQIDKLQRSLL